VPEEVKPGLERSLKEDRGDGEGAKVASVAGCQVLRRRGEERRKPEDDTVCETTLNPWTTQAAAGNYGV
jgi:hypothetical protein